MLSFIKMVISKRAARLAPAAAVVGVLGASLLVGAPGIIGLGTGFTYGVPACTAADITPSLTSPRDPGTAITLTGSSTGCTSPEYKFWLLPPGGATWVAQNNYSATTTFNWATTGLATGTWQIGVWARQVGSTATYEAYAIRTYALTGCSSARIGAIPQTPATIGTPVTFTGVATGCSTTQYEFWWLANGTNTWVIVQPYSATATFPWTTTGLTAGPYRIGVWVKSTGSPNSYDSFAIMTFWLT